ncbi:replicative DNA helicase [Heyndrickxia oleronia]|jgi:replicative DNA helicase|uniref:replicative DNA helicase n=1 Tax=Heyndrickxia oleronia TaxID=38875 RepID=UPI00242EF6C1|nr:DnaB-like helicase C-terminal domain-containing protein [Heyndrickxia oleronia]MCI1593072.1 DNA helicase [Heyndrickxia oleronia]MCI1615482.1 DNA helicase [Heyndrickxia oleronia]MCI1746168.1 DNA helicase [Heyndrickxia oleronia]MCI1763551.1 DNA helicase [Heyndrickxia oleronia]
MIAEKAFLGSILRENYLLKDTNIKQDYFEDIRHKELFKIMLDLNKKGKNVDVVTLTTLVNLESFGGISYLNEILSYANVEKFEEFEDLIIESWKEREKRNILNKAHIDDWEISKVINALDQINETKLDDHTPISDALIKMYEAPWEEKSIKKGVPTGLKILDSMTNGFQDSELTIIAARPSMGKTDILIHFAKQAGWQGYLPCIFSLEMPEEKITDRLIASTGNFNRMKMRDPYNQLTEKQKDAWSFIIGRVADTNVQIFDDSGQSVAEIRAKTRKMIHSFPNLKPIIFIDYLTLIRPVEFYGGNANLQVSEISRDLKAMAKDLKCPVVTLAQLSRSVESRQDKRPMMSDIRDSGSVEQDADLIMFLYREKYYNSDSSDDTLEIIARKNRNGPVGTVLTKYNAHTGEIIDADPRSL